MKGQKILKVTSILMIIGGVIAVVVGVLAILGIRHSRYQRSGGTVGEHGGDRTALCQFHSCNGGLCDSVHCGH